jgi:hypothetical protein
MGRRATIDIRIKIALIYRCAVTWDLGNDTSRGRLEAGKESDQSE